MARVEGQAGLHKAKSGKNDEFYTQLCDIERELQHYEPHFYGKTVLCNCDDFRRSNFAKYFLQNFARLGLKKLICSCYQKADRGFYVVFTDGAALDDVGTDRLNTDGGNADGINLEYFAGDGDFRSAECIALLQQADIVVTNPPFSLFREFLGQLVEHRKRFLVVSNINAITYKEVFGLIKQNQVWLGVNMGRGISGFIVPEHYHLYGQETCVNEHGERIVATNNCMWLTNLDNMQRHELIPLTKQYAGHEQDYPHYDNYDGINVNRTKDIPADFAGVMGVPITFLHKFNPEQFEIIKFRKGDDGKDLRVNGKSTYFRILIRRKQV